jgi:hypothetical protein
LVKSPRTGRRTSDDSVVRREVKAAYHETLRRDGSGLARKEEKTSVQGSDDAETSTGAKKLNVVGVGVVCIRGSRQHRSRRGGRENAQSPMKSNARSMRPRARTRPPELRCAATRKRKTVMKKAYMN